MSKNLLLVEFQLDIKSPKHKLIIFISDPLNIITLILIKLDFKLAEKLKKLNLIADVLLKVCN